jgi:hypothetical protein
MVTGRAISVTLWIADKNSEKDAMSNMPSSLETKLRIYYITATFSLLFAVVGFSYNAWRMEVSEKNNNIRTAAFESLTELAKLQQLIYAAHYDKDTVAGNPRTGWVRVELIVELSTLIDMQVHQQALILKQSWSQNWGRMANDRQATDELINKIDVVRASIRTILKTLP